MMTMDSAARAIDMMLHRGRAEERDGGVWLDDLAAHELSADVCDEYGTPWRKAAEEWEKEHDRVEGERNAIIKDRETYLEAGWTALGELAGDLDDHRQAIDSETVGMLIDMIEAARNALDVFEPKQ